MMRCPSICISQVCVNSSGERRRPAPPGTSERDARSRPPRSPVGDVAGRSPPSSAMAAPAAAGCRRRWRRAPPATCMPVRPQVAEQTPHQTAVVGLAEDFFFVKRQQRIRGLSKRVSIAGASPGPAIRTPPAPPRAAACDAARRRTRRPPPARRACLARRCGRDRATKSDRRRAPSRCDATTMIDVRSRITPRSRAENLLLRVGVHRRQRIVQDQDRRIENSARASAVRCFCPPDSVMPRSPTKVS